MSKQLHEKQQDLDLDLQNKHFIETPDGVVKWVTTSQLTGGLNFTDYSITRNLKRAVDPTTFIIKNTGNGLGSNDVSKIFVSGNNVYVATSGGLSISTDGGTTFTNYTTSDGLGSNLCYDVYVSGANVYVATTGGVSISSDYGATYTNYTTANGLQSNSILSIYVDNNTIYVGYSSGTYRLSTSSTSSISFTTLPNVVNSPIALHYQIYANGNNIYVTRGGSLNISYDAGQSWVSRGTADGIGGLTITGLFVSNSNVYVCTQAGLSISTDGGITFTNYTTANGLGDNYCSRVYVLNNVIYVSNLGGLSISGVGTTTFTNYTTANGLGANNCGSVYVVNGKAYVGTAATGLSISSSIWQRISTGSGTLTEHDIATSSIDDYATASGAAGSTATLTQIMRKTISLITSFLKFFISEATDATSSTDANASFRTAGGAAIAKKLYVGTDLNVSGNYPLPLKVTSTTDSTSTSTGSGIFSGGLGVAKDAFIGGGLLEITGADPYLNIHPSSGSFATIQFNDTAALRFAMRYRSDTSLFQISRYNSSSVLQEHTFEIDAVAGNITARKPLSITDTTASSSSTTGALLSAGGLGVAEDAYIGGNVYTATAPTGWAADTFAGYGSTDTKIPYFTNVRVNNILNTDITVVNNATNGCKITINTAGLYSISYSTSADNTAVVHAGISLNSTQLTTNAGSINTNTRLAIETAAIGCAANMSVTRWLAATDVIRPHSDGSTPATAAWSRFSIVKIL